MVRTKKPLCVCYSCPEAHTSATHSRALAGGRTWEHLEVGRWVCVPIEPEHSQVSRGCVTLLEGGPLKGGAGIATP